MRLHGRWAPLPLYRRPKESLQFHHHNNIAPIRVHLRVYMEPSNILSHFSPWNMILADVYIALCSLQSTFKYFWFSQKPTWGTPVCNEQSQNSCRDPSALQNNRGFWAGQMGGRDHVWYPSLICFSILLSLALGNKPAGLLITNVSNVSLTVTLLTE